MAYENTKKEYTKKTTTTNAIQLYGVDGFGESSLRLGFWEQRLTIGIVPALPKEARTDNAVYDYEKEESGSISLEKAVLLLEEIKETILPAIKDRKIESVGVPAGRNHILVIGSGINGNITPYAALHRIDDDLKSTHIAYYEFRTSSAIINYDPDTANYEERFRSIELSLFMTFLESAVVGLLHSATHSERHVNSFTKSTQSAMLKSIADKLGVVEQVPYNPSSRMNAFDRRAKESSNSTSTLSTSVPTETYQNVNELDELMKM